MRAVVFGRNRSTRSTWVGRQRDAESNLVVAYETARVCVGGRSFAPASPSSLPLAPPPPPNRSRSRKLACVGRSPFRLPACLAHGMGSSMLRDLGIDTTEYTSSSTLSRDITILSVTPNPTPPCHSPRLSCPSPLQNSFLANERSPITPPIVSRKSKPRLLLSRSKTHRRSRNTFTPKPTSIAFNTMFRQLSKSVSKSQSATRSIQKRGLAFASPSHRAKEATVSINRSLLALSLIEAIYRSMVFTNRAACNRTLASTRDTPSLTMSKQLCFSSRLVLRQTR